MCARFFFLFCCRCCYNNFFFCFFVNRVYSMRMSSSEKITISLSLLDADVRDSATVRSTSYRKWTVQFYACLLGCKFNTHNIVWQVWLHIIILVRIFQRSKLYCDGNYININNNNNKKILTTTTAMVTAAAATTTAEKESAN